MTGAVPAFFRAEGDVLVGNDPARGPWSPDHCHAGPVAALVIRAAEAVAGPGRVLTRLTMDIVRPLPLSGLRIVAEATRTTRTLVTTTATVHDHDGTLCVSASTMHLAEAGLGPLPTAQVPAPPFDAARGASMAVLGRRHDKSGFAHANEIRVAEGDGFGKGPATIWMRSPDIVEGEVPSPAQRLAPLADCGNGISCNAPPEALGFMNTDLTLHLHRLPASDWLASRAVSHWHGNGVGMAQAELFDRHGPVGAALQSLVLRPHRF